MRKLSIGDVAYLIDRRNGKAIKLGIVSHIDLPKTRIDVMGLPLYDSRTWYTVGNRQYNEIDIYHYDQVVWVGYPIIEGLNA